mmetsp:Transcript_1625/g.2916  ORF Transcript_1625/g.2916 Transcript_1625/m.2916 type:complete len:234 (-) Transcript_1625:2188-2889(-)
MSLSFVKSAVLSSTDGISHNEETTINTSETASIRASSTNSASHKPLFEQLRANKEIQDAKDDEFQKSIRGMQALDDEDVAHLDAIEEQKREVEYKVKSGIEREVALFHAAREDRGLVQTVIEDQEGVDDGDGSNKNDDEDKKSPGGDDTARISAVPAAKKHIVPKFTIKKKRKRVDAESKDGTAQKKISGSTEMKSGKDDDGEKKQAEEEETKNNNIADLLGLGCYGSDSDSD